jgi:hypothetical protein
MKQRIEGRVQDGCYVIAAPDGGIMKQIPLSEARGDRKLAAAISRNGWESIPNE